MLHFLQKQNYIVLIPTQDAYFYKANLPKNIKLSKELLQLNYESHSPFKSKEIIAVEEKGELLLWFSVNDITAPIAIPEDYLLYLTLKNQYKNSIIFLETTEFIKVIVIKNSQLENLFFTESVDQNFIQICKDEYALEDVVTYTKDRHNTLLQNSKKNLTLFLLYKFFRVNLQPKEMFNTTIEKVSYPVSFLLIFAMVINFYHNSSLEKRSDILRSEYKNLQHKNQDISDALQNHNKQMKFYTAFMDKELHYPDSFVVLEELYKVLDDEGGSYLHYLTATQGKLVLKIQTSKSPVELLNRLSALSEFKSVLLGLTYRTRSQAPVYTYNIKLKSVGVEE